MANGQRNTVDGEVVFDNGDPDRPEYDVTTTYDERLAQAVETLRGWADQADGHTVTQGNTVATVQKITDNLAVFYDRFADLLEREYGTRL